MDTIEYSNVKELYQESLFATYATVNDDGSPHASPMFYIPSADGTRLYMGTQPDSLHARNMTRTSQAFATVYGRLPAGMRGLYFRLENCHEAADSELAEALAAHNAARQRIGKPALPREYYETPNPQRMYICDIAEISTNDVMRQPDGFIRKDTRMVISASDLLRSSPVSQ